MLYIDKLKELYEDVKKIENEYRICRQKIIDEEQYKIPISERITTAEKMLTLCKEDKNKKMEYLLNSDIELYKFRTSYDKVIYTDNKNIIIEYAKEIAKKYNNILITEKDYESIYNDSNYCLDNTEKNTKNMYISKMFEKELGQHHVLHCLDKKIIDKYKEVCEKEYISYPHYNNKNIIFEKTINKYPELKNYPSHEEYMKCNTNRENKYF